MAKKFGDAYIEVHARTEKARAELAAFAASGGKDLDSINKKGALPDVEKGANRLKGLGKEADGAGRKVSRLEQLAQKLNKRFDATTNSVRRLEKRFNKSFNPMHVLTEKLATSWARMDSTVRLVIGLIASAGGPTTALLSGLSSSATALVASLGYAAAGLGAVAGVLPGLAYGVGLAVSGFKNISTLAPEASSALDGLKAAFSNVDVPAFMAEWNASLAGFFSNLDASLRSDTLAASLGATFAKVTDALSNVITGDMWAPFIDAMEGPLATALGNLFSSLEPIINAVLAFLTAAAPWAVTLTDMFGKWAEQWSAAFQAWTGSADFAVFMNNTVTSLDTLFGLLGAVKDFIGTVFAAGVDTGNAFLGLLQGIFENWTTFLQTAEGQNALADWFETGRTVLLALGPLLEGLGQGLNNMVTPETTKIMADLFSILGSLLPILGSIIEVVSELGILNLIGQFLLEIGKALEPILPSLSTLANSIFSSLMTAVQSLAPVLEVFAGIFGQLAVALGPVIQQAAEAFAEIMVALAPVIQQVFDAVMPIVPLLADFLVGAIQALLPMIIELATQFGAIAAQLITALMPVIEALLPILMSLLPVFVQLVVAANPLLNLFLNLLPVFMPLIELIANLVTWLLNLIAPIIEVTAGFLAFLVQFLAVGKGVGKVTDEVVGFFKNMFKWIGDIFTRVFLWVDDFLKVFQKWRTSLGNTVKGAWDSISSQFTGAVTFLRSTITGWIDDILGFFTKWKTSLGNKVTDIWNNVKSLFTTATGAVKNTVSGFIDDVLNFFTRLPGNIRNSFRNMAETISSPFKSAFNSIARAWNNTIGKLSWTVPDWIPGLGGSSISAPKLPEFAAGGIVAGPLTALVGEAGPEAIVPLNRPLSQVDPSVRAISAMLQGKGGPSRFASGGIVGGGVTIAEGAITVVARESNPALVAQSVVDRIALYNR